MYGAIQQHLAAQLEEIQKAGSLQGRARARRRRSRPTSELKGGADVLNCAPTITSAWPIIPKSCRRPPTHSTTGATAWPRCGFICGTQEPHKATRERTRPLSRDRGHHPVFLVLGCQRRVVRDAARARRMPSSRMS